LIVSVKSTEVVKPAGAGAGVWPLAGGFVAGVLAATGATGTAFADSGFNALLDITNLRRTGGVFNFGAFGLLLSLVRGALFAAVALRFNINNQTKEPDAGSVNQ
jgi:hypothetical protein